MPLSVPRDYFTVAMLPASSPAVLFTHTPESLPPVRNPALFGPGILLFLRLVLLFAFVQVSRFYCDFWLTEWSGHTYPSLSEVQYVWIYASLTLLTFLLVGCRGYYFASIILSASLNLHDRLLSCVVRVRSLTSCLSSSPVLSALAFSPLLLPLCTNPSFLRFRLCLHCVLSQFRLQFQLTLI